MMLKIFHLVKIILPIICAFALGVLFLFSVEHLGYTLNTLLSWLVISAILLTTIGIILFIAYQIAMKKISSKSNVEEIFNKITVTPEEIINPDFYKNEVAPHAGNVIKAIITWLSFTSAIGMSVALLTSIILLATLAVQYQQSEKLSTQNENLIKQNEIIQEQSKIIEGESLAVLLSEYNNLREIINDMENSLLKIKVYENYFSTNNAIVNINPVQGNTPLINNAILADASICSTATNDCKQTIKEIFDYISETDDRKPNVRIFNNNILANFARLTNGPLENLLKTVSGSPQSKISLIERDCGLKPNNSFSEHYDSLLQAVYFFEAYLNIMQQNKLTDELKITLEKRSASLIMSLTFMHPDKSNYIRSNFQNIQEGIGLLISYVIYEKIKINEILLNIKTSCSNELENLYSMRDQLKERMNSINN